MNERERNRRPDENSGQAGGTPGGGNLERYRDEGAQMAQAGNDMIEKALSSNSVAFNQQVKQRGGQ